MFTSRLEFRVESRLKVYYKVYYQYQCLDQPRSQGPFPGLRAQGKGPGNEVVFGSFKFWTKNRHTSELTDETHISLLRRLLPDKTGKEGARK